MTKEKLVVSIKFSSAIAKKIIASLVVLNLFVLAGYLVFIIYYRTYLSGDWGTGGIAKHFLVHFHLATENVLAVWYSSMLLLFASVTCILCLLVDSQDRKSVRQGYLRYGWLLCAAIFALLSLDEIGSLHERIGMLAVLNPYADNGLGWVKALALPIGIVTLFMVAFSWLHLRRSPWTFYLMILGVVLFIVNPLFEVVEMAMLEANSGRVNLRLEILMLLEESAEIFGSLSFVSAALTYLVFILNLKGESKTGPQSQITFSINLQHALIFVSMSMLVLGLIMLGIEFVVSHTQKGDTGIPINWFPAALGFLAALVSLTIWSTVESEKRSVRLLYILLAIYCLFLSAYYGANLKAWLYMPNYSGLFRPSVIGVGLVLLAFVFGIILFQQVKLWWGRLGAIAWPVLLGSAFLFGKVYAVGPMDFLAFAVLLVSLLSHLYRWQR
ncbi:MAG: hypothetical protein ACN4GR_12500 [Arenicellales bacterium]